MSEREPMIDASLQQFLDDFIRSLETPTGEGDGDDDGPADLLPATVRTQRLPD